MAIEVMAKKANLMEMRQGQGDFCSGPWLKVVAAESCQAWLSDSIRLKLYDERTHVYTQHKIHEHKQKVTTLMRLQKGLCIQFHPRKKLQRTLNARKKIHLFV